MSSITTTGYICDSCGIVVQVLTSYAGLHGLEATTTPYPPNWHRIPLIGGSELRCYDQCPDCHLKNRPLPK